MDSPCRLSVMSWSNSGRASGSSPARALVDNPAATARMKSASANRLVAMRVLLVSVDGHLEAHDPACVHALEADLLHDLDLGPPRRQNGCNHERSGDGGGQPQA